MMRQNHLCDIDVRLSYNPDMGHQMQLWSPFRFLILHEQEMPNAIQDHNRTPHLEGEEAINRFR